MRLAHQGPVMSPHCQRMQIDVCSPRRWNERTLRATPLPFLMTFVLLLLLLLAEEKKEIVETNGAIVLNPALKKIDWVVENLQ